jgi:hypothetical protein
MSNNVGGVDPITTMSQLSGGPGLDAPNPFPDIPDDPPNFDPEEHPMFVQEPVEERPQGGAPKTVSWIPHARVYIVDEDGNDAYEKLLLDGANGVLVLGRKEVADIKGSAAYKVYQEWLVPVKAKKESPMERRRREG